MKIDYDGGGVRIKADIWGDKRHIRVYTSSEKGQDYYSISLIKDGMEYWCLPSIYIYKEDVIIHNNLEKGRQIYK